MNNDFNGLELIRDDDPLTQELRAIYAPPADAAYWSFLERRIMDRLSLADGDSWWAVSGTWLRAGLMAAGIAVIVAGTLLLRTQTQMARAEYETVIDPATIDAPTLAARERLSEQQSNVRILTGH
ncbi:MAG: hypothetical protein NTZ43_10780 [Gemmatimonadetes bacterium]|nr:hypothetical protein [Gemmatimonadota bacterium]